MREITIPQDRDDSQFWVNLDSENNHVIIVINMPRGEFLDSIEKTEQFAHLVDGAVRALISLFGGPEIEKIPTQKIVREVQTDERKGDHLPSRDDSVRP